MLTATQCVLDFRLAAAIFLLPVLGDAVQQRYKRHSTTWAKKLGIAVGISFLCGLERKIWRLHVFAYPTSGFHAAILCTWQISTWLERHFAPFKFTYPTLYHTWQNSDANSKTRGDGRFDPPLGENVGRFGLGVRGLTGRNRAFIFR